MTKEEMLKKIGELSPEQKDFLKKEIKKHSPKTIENSLSTENGNGKKPESKTGK